MDGRDFNFVSQDTIDDVVFVAQGSFNITQYGTLGLESDPDIPLLLRCAISFDNQNWITDTYVESTTVSGNITSVFVRVMWNNLRKAGYDSRPPIELEVSTSPTFPGGPTYTGPVYYKVIGSRI